MNKQANTQASSSFNKESATSSAPVEISLEQLQQVSGGSPKGGWIIQPPDFAAESLSVEAPSPKGGW